MNSPAGAENVDLLRERCIGEHRGAEDVVQWVLWREYLGMESTHHPLVGYASSFAIYVLLSAVLTGTSMLLVHEFSPAARGSGIPDVKAAVSGFDLPHSFSGSPRLSLAGAPHIDRARGFQLRPTSKACTECDEEREVVSHTSGRRRLRRVESTAGLSPHRHSLGNATSLWSLLGRPSASGLARVYRSPRSDYLGMNLLAIRLVCSASAWGAGQQRVATYDVSMRVAAHDLRAWR